eukprot:gene8917-9654_t
MVNIIYDHGVMDIIGTILADAEKHDYHINALNIARYYYRVNMKSDDPNKQLIVLHYFRYRLTVGNDEENVDHNFDLLMKGLKDIIKKLLGEHEVEKLEDAMHSIYDFGGINIINQLLSQADDEVDSDVRKVLTNFIHQANVTSKDLQK